MVLLPTMMSNPIEQILCLLSARRKRVYRNSSTSQSLLGKFPTSPVFACISAVGTHRRFNDVRSYVGSRG
jgi:hypothetical protein